MINHMATAWDRGWTRALAQTVDPEPDRLYANNLEAQTPAAWTFDRALHTVLGTLSEVLAGFLRHLPLLVAAGVVLVATAGLSLLVRRLVRRLLRGVKLRPSLKDLAVRFASVGAWAGGLLMAAMVAFPGLTPARALTALGLGSLAIGLAFKDIFENFFAGVLILWRFPFENGDFISCAGVTGRVVDVTVRNTVLRTVSGELVVMPNVDLYKNPVDVLTHRPYRRAMIACGVAYGEDVGAARKVIHNAVSACPTVQVGRGVEVFAGAFGESSIDFEVAWWAGSTPLDQRTSRDEVVEAIKQALDNAGIEIPFPYRTLTFKGDSPVAVRQAEPGGDSGEHG
ncbi:MAG: mechanosensitive ion channel family protein [Planctomycetota bacterium]